MTRLNRGAAGLAVASALILGCSLSVRGQNLPAAQDDSTPPANVGGPDATQPDAQQPDAAAPDDADLVVRVERLEDQIRQMNGQIEQMQYENRQLADQLRKFQQDVDFRFQEVGHGRVPRHSEEFNPASAPAPLAPVATSESGPSPLPAPARGPHDAFDPTADPNAPGAPHSLGSPASASTAPPAVSATGGPSEADSGAPLNLPSSEYKAPDAPPVAAPAAQPQAGPLATPGGTMIASAEVNPTKEEFDVALGYFKQRDYDDAEKSFAAFIQNNPKSHLTSDALYYLGETYYQRGRQREAAEQYLKISTDYATSSRAPEAMLRLGQSLQALGAKEQACATFSEVTRKYPNASAAVKAGAEREAKRAEC
jgi:tol-pal system protein YbgF